MGKIRIQNKSRSFSISHRSHIISEMPQMYMMSWSLSKWYWDKVTMGNKNIKCFHMPI